MINIDLNLQPPDPLTEAQRERLEQLYAAAHAFAYELLALTPIGREQSVAVTQLETAVLWAAIAIERYEDIRRGQPT